MEKNLSKNKKRVMDCDDSLVGRAGNESKLNSEQLLGFPVA